MTWAYIVSLMVTGIFAWWYKGFAKDTLSGWRLFRRQKNKKESILELRKSIVAKTNSLLQ